MCDCNVKCFETDKPVKYRKLTLLLLDCWQREYDKRPYDNFQFKRLDFEKRMQRVYNPIEDFDIIVQFVKTRMLVSIKLIGCNVVANETKLINNFLTNLNNLQCIELQLMQLPKEFFETFEKNIENMNIKELVLEGTPLDDNAITYLRSILIKSETIQFLNVANCGINQYNFAKLADGIHKSKSIKSFYASRLLGQFLTLDSEKIALVVSALIWQNKLKEIEMKKCEFMAQDMQIIAEYLYCKYSNLTKLNLAFNKIGSDGVAYLLKAIATSGTLKYLNISGCGLGTHGGEQVAKYLSSCCHLEALLIQYNDIEAEAVNMILLCIKKPLKLTKLYLWGNKYNTRTGNILRCLIEPRILAQDYLDITYTYDDTLPGYRVIPWKDCK